MKDVEMTEFEPKHTLSFRPGTPEMVVLGVLIVLGAAFAAFVAKVWKWVDCCSESGLTASSAAEMQYVVALLGVVPALGMLVESIRVRGHPWRWFFGTCIVYLVWAVLVSAWVV